MPLCTQASGGTGPGAPMTHQRFWASVGGKPAALAFFAKYYHREVKRGGRRGRRPGSRCLCSLRSRARHLAQPAGSLSAAQMVAIGWNSPADPPPPPTHTTTPGTPRTPLRSPPASWLSCMRGWAAPRRRQSCTWPQRWLWQQARWGDAPALGVSVVHLRRRRCFGRGRSRAASLPVVPVGCASWRSAAQISSDTPAHPAPTSQEAWPARAQQVPPPPVLPAAGGGRGETPVQRELARARDAYARAGAADKASSPAAPAETTHAISGARA